MSAGFIRAEKDETTIFGIAPFTALALTKYRHKSAQNPQHIHTYLEALFPDSINEDASMTLNADKAAGMVAIKARTRRLKRRPWACLWRNGLIATITQIRFLNNSMKRLFDVTVFGAGFRNHVEYERIVSAHGGDSSEDIQTLSGSEQELPRLREDLLAAGLQETSKPEESDQNRFFIRWRVEFEGEDWSQADILVLSGARLYLAENATADALDKIRIDLSDQGLWEIQDEVMEKLYGDAPALFSGCKGLRLANDPLRRLVQSGGLQGIEFLDGVTLRGENAGKVKQKLWVFTSNVKLPAMEPDVIFQNDKRRVLLNKDIQGPRLWCSETVVKYRRSELDRVGFVDVGEIGEGKRPTSLMGPLLISRKAFEFFREAGVPLDCYPALVVGCA